MKPDDIPKDVRLLAGQVVVMLPPMYSAHKTGKAIDRIARAILAERARWEAEVERLREAVNFTLSDYQRLLRKSDVEGVCDSIGTCFEDRDGVARCGPCAIKIAEANGAAVVKWWLPKAPQEARLTRELHVAQSEITKLREALGRAEAALVEAAIPLEAIVAVGARHDSLAVFAGAQNAVWHIRKYMDGRAAALSKPNAVSGETE